MVIVCWRGGERELVLVLLLHLTCCFQHHHHQHHHHHHHFLHHNNHPNFTGWLKHSEQLRHGRHSRNDGHHYHHHHNLHTTSTTTTEPPPTFDLTSPTNIKAQQGSTAYLPCKINNLGTKSVSWVRNRDAHILSVDQYMFITDERFAAWHQPVTDTWTLQIKFLEAGDAGRYECQVSTEPKMSNFVHLHVITPQVTIPGGSELHVQSGSTVTIKCVISHALHPPKYAFWYHGDHHIPVGSWPGVEPGEVEGVAGVPNASVASLTITAVTLAHTGNYTCCPAALTPVSAILHVINGERPAAMQHGTSDSSSLPPSFTLLFATSFPLLCLMNSRQYR